MYTAENNPSAVWARMDADRSSFLHRCERYAALTIPGVCLPMGVDEKNSEMSLDYQSMGAVGVNHFVNKLMLLMFPPGRPMFRATIPAKELERLQLDNTTAQKMLADTELRAMRLFEDSGSRPALFRVLRQAAVTGNGLLHFQKKTIRSRNIRDFVVSRCLDGAVHTLVMRDGVIKAELPEELKAYASGGENTKQMVYTMVRRVGNHYEEVRSINNLLIPHANGQDVAVKKYSTYEDCPYKVIPWDLEDYADYATGVVEHASRDLLALHYLSKALVEGALVASEVRYLVASTAETLLNDLNKSKNGQFIAGNAGDIQPVTGGNAQALVLIREAIADFSSRIGRTFLMNSAATRQAERVTAAEIRANAQELETVYGALTASLGINLQKPVALWLLNQMELSVKNTAVEVSVLTGADALGRGVEMENFGAAMQYLQTINRLPPQIASRILLEQVTDFIGQGTQTDMSRFFMSDADVQRQQAEMQQQQVNQQAALGAVQPEGAR